METTDIQAATTQSAGDQTKAIVGEDTIIEYPGVDVLGCVYNVLADPYARKEYAIRRVVDGILNAPSDRLVEIDTAARLFYRFPATVAAERFSQTVAEVAAGASLKTFSNELAVRVGVEEDCGAFSGEVTVGLGLETSTSASNYYITVLDARYTASAYFDPADLDKGTGLSLNAAFKNALNDPGYSPSKLFEDYGTHVVTGIRIGGQVRFTAYAEEDTYSRESDFQVDAKAKYTTLSGSSSFKGALDTASSMYMENIQYGGSLLIYGGSAEGQAAVQHHDGSGGFSTWIESVDFNPEFADFLPRGGLVPVWELCDDPARADALKAAFEANDVRALANERLVAANGGSEYDKNDYKSLDANADDPDAELASFASGKSHVRYWSKNTDTEVLVGVGVNVNTNDNFNKMLVKVRDFITGKTRLIAVGDGASKSPGDYEVWYEVPAGCAVTGLGLRAKKEKATNLVVYYQQLDLDDPENGYLDPDRKAAYVGGKLSEYEISYTPPETGNRAVAVGLLLRGANSTFDQLVLKVADIG